MGFIDGNQYTMEVYLTNKGLEKLYDLGLKDTALFFSVGNSEADYNKYYDQYGELMELIVEDGDFSNAYYVDSGGTETTVKESILTRLAGKVQNNNATTTQIIRSSEQTIKDLVLLNEDIDTSIGYNLVAYKEESTKKYFNISLVGSPKYPVILGGMNAYSGGTQPDPNDWGLYHEEAKQTKIGGYTSVFEPTNEQVVISDYAPFPGVSVSDGTYGETEWRKFTLFNKSSKSIYIDSYDLNRIYATNTHAIKSKTIYIDPDNDDQSIIEYLIEWTNLFGQTYEDGKLYVKTKTSLLNGTKGFLAPFENIPFYAKYEVVSPGLTSRHYHGQSLAEPNKKEGVLQFTFRIEASKTKINGEVSNDDRLTTDMGIIVQVKDSGYVYSESIDYGQSSDFGDSKIQLLADPTSASWAVGDYKVYTINVETDHSWQATSWPSWINIQGAAGIGDASFTITPFSSAVYDRSGIVTLETNTLPAVTETISVFQSGSSGSGGK